MCVIRVILMFNIFRMSTLVTARFCEGGHYCSLPRECCTQGCCPPYQSGPRQLPPASEHVLNLFFISHWFFWCVVVAIILAILCAYSLWKKRRTLCGWGFNDHHAQSEGDSAGSCYAPPQYSRCNSFHHPPPPYTEVTSKPDLYPLVFTCNSDNAKTGSSYLMVQYFRNYIVRPVGSLSAASTVDSLSSSFICNINEANTLIPPPYSRAASPELGYNSHFQQQFMIPRSASQLVYANGANGINNTATHDISEGIVAQQVYQGQQSRGPHFTVMTLNGSLGSNQNGLGIENAANSSISYSTILQPSVGENFNINEDSDENNCNYINKHENNDCDGSGSGSNRSSRCGSNASAGCIPKSFTQSKSDQQFRYVNNSSNSNISDIFINNSSVAAYTNAINGSGIKSLDIINLDETGKITPTEVPEATNTFSTNCQINNHRIQPNYKIGITKTKPLHRTSTNPTQFVVESSILRPDYNSCDSVASISLAVPSGKDVLSQAEFNNLQILQQSLETCCHIIKQQQQQQQQQQQKQQQQLGARMSGAESPPFLLNELNKKYTTDDVCDYKASVNCSTVSSLTNVCTPSSPPQATSPTGGVREILEQIRQLQDGLTYEDMLLHMRPALSHTSSSPVGTSLGLAKVKSANPQGKAHRNSITCCEIQPMLNVSSPTNPTFSKTTVRLATSSPDKGNGAVITTTTENTTGSLNRSETFLKRPLTLQQSKKKFFASKPCKALYIPMMPNISSTPSNRCFSKSPISNIGVTNFFSGKGGRVRKIWVSRSAPTTPGSALPPNRLSDNSPLLTEHDEDQETEQNENIE